MRSDIEFDAEGVTLRGWLYAPDERNGPVPAIVMAHGYSAVKEMYLDRFAEHFVSRGLAAVVFDNRNFGASGGEPRQEIDPWAQVRDYRHAITWAERRHEIDAQRIGVWGSDYSGGHALVVGAVDRRVTCVVSQVPLVSGRDNFRALVSSAFLADVRTQFDDDRRARFAGKDPTMVPVVDADPSAPAALPTPDSYEWFMTTHEERAPSWRNQVTMRSVEMLTEYEPGGYVPRISPTPLLMIVARGDHLTPAEFAIAAFARANEPKRLEILPGSHYDAYTDDFDLAADAAADWFVQHLRT